MVVVVYRVMDNYLYLIHLAFLMKERRSWVNHCPGVGLEPVVEPIDQALLEYEKKKGWS